MYNYSLFANGVVLHDDPDVPATAVTADPDTISVVAGEKLLCYYLTPVNSTAITAASSAVTKATVEG